MFHNIADSIEEAKDHLSELDGEIGDADHGVTMSIGFQAVKNELSKRNIDAMAPDDLMNLVAMAFLNSIGASTGPLYATGFRRAAQAIAGATDATPEVEAALIKGITDGVKERGKGRRGGQVHILGVGRDLIPSEGLQNARAGYFSAFFGSVQVAQRFLKTGGELQDILGFKIGSFAVQYFFVRGDRGGDDGNVLAGGFQDHDRH